MLDLSSPHRKRFEIDMTPLIDVVFLLLIFFMLTFAVQGQGLAISLPQGEESRQQEKENLIVKIDQNNNLLLNDRQIQIDSLKDVLSEELLGRADKLVVIDAAPKVNYGLFAQVLDISREAGAINFSILE